MSSLPTSSTHDNNDLNNMLTLSLTLPNENEIVISKVDSANFDIKHVSESTNSSDVLNTILSNNYSNKKQTQISNSKNPSSSVLHQLIQQHLQNNHSNTSKNYTSISSSNRLSSFTNDIDNVLLKNGEEDILSKVINTHGEGCGTNFYHEQQFKTNSSTSKVENFYSNSLVGVFHSSSSLNNQQELESPPTRRIITEQLANDLPVNNNITSTTSLLSLMASDELSIAGIINNNNTNTNNNNNNNNNNISNPIITNDYIMNSLNTFNGQININTSSNQSQQQSIMNNNNYNNGNQNLPQNQQTSSPPLVPNIHHHMLSSNPLYSQTNKASNMMMVGSSPPTQQLQPTPTSIHSSSHLLFNNNQQQSSHNNLYPQQPQTFNNSFSATSLMNNNNHNIKPNIGLSTTLKPDSHTTPSPSNNSSSTTNGFNNSQQQVSQLSHYSMMDNNNYGYQQQNNNSNMYSQQQIINSSVIHQNIPSASPNLSMDHQQQGNIQFQFHQHTPNQKKRGRQSNSNNTPQTYQFQYYNGNSFTNGTSNNTTNNVSNQPSCSYQPFNNQSQQSNINDNNNFIMHQNLSNSSSSNTPLMYNNNNNINNNNNNSNGSNTNSGGIPKEAEQFSSIEPYMNEDEDEDDDDEEENEDDDDCEYHPIACVQCRQLHKKCDKKLPACTKCVSRGVECTYRTPKRNTSQPLPKKKKKKKKGSKNSLAQQPYTSPSQNVNSMIKNKVLDLYFTCLCPDFPLIDRSEMEFYLSDACPIGTPNKKEMEVLFMAIRALCEYRCGSIENGHKAIQEARQALATVFTDYTNFYVACTYCYMSYVESMNHDIKTANFFLKLVEYHLQDIPTDQLDEKQQILKRYHAFAKTSVSNRLLNDFTGNVMDVIKQIPQLYSLSTGQSLPPEFHNIVNQEITSSNYQEMLDVVETLFKLLHVQTDNLSKPVDVKDLRRIDLVYLLMTNGLKIAILTKAGERKDLIEESALKITYTTYSQLYAFSSIDMMGYVALGARVHYHIVRAIEAGQRSNFTNGIISLDGKIGSIDYYEILNNDLRAINLLKRYLRTPSPYFENLCSDIQLLLQNRGKGLIEPSTEPNL